MRNVSPFFGTDYNFLVFVYDVFCFNGTLTVSYSFISLLVIAFLL